MKQKLLSVFLAGIICFSSIQTSVLANSHTRTSNEIINDTSKSNEITEVWDSELSSTLAISCDWLSNQNKGDLLYLALGSSGKTASSNNVNYYINEISLQDKFSSLLELSYAILNSTFCGYSAVNILGKNLIIQFDEFDNLEKESLESLCYALLALNSNPYKISKDDKNFSENLCIEYILKHQNSDGGFKLTINAKNSDVTSTALALIALSEYKDNKKIIKTINLGLEYIKKNQNIYGGFDIKGQPSSIPLSYVIMALCSLGIPIDTPEFNPNSDNLISVLINRYSNIDGSFANELNGKEDILATELAILALSATKNNKSPFKLDRPLVVNGIKISKNVIKEDEHKQKNENSSFFTKDNIIVSSSLLLIITLAIIINFKRKKR